MIRKFYDVAASEPTSQPEAKYELTFEPLSQDAVFDGFQEKEEVVEVVQEPTKETPQEPEKVEVVTPVIPEVVEPAAQPIPIPTPDWRELVLKQDQKEVFKVLNIDESQLALSKELAADEFVSKLLTYRKENGNLTPFIEAATKDWDKVSDIELLRDELKRQYPTLSNDKFEKLAKAEIDRRFLLGDDSLDEEVELAAIRLETEGNKIRLARKEEQKKFLDSVKPVDRTAEQQRLVNERLAAEQQEFELWRNSIESNPATVRLMSDKKIVLGEKEKAFNYTVNPDTIKEKTLDTNKFYGQFWDAENGKNVFNVDKWNRVAAYAENPSLFEQALINHGISLGTKEVVEKELVNQSPKSNQQPQTKAKSLAMAFATEAQPMSDNDFF